jgi:hypothetical protein
LPDITIELTLIKQNETDFVQPVYAGKAIPKGGLKGGLDLDVPAGECLYNRSNKHRRSSGAAENSSIENFHCRFLAVYDIWIPLGESLLSRKQSRFGILSLTVLEAMNPESGVLGKKFPLGIPYTPA